MPSSEDKFDGSHCYIHVNPSQKKFHLYGDDPEEIQISDIANSLSKQCRFNGHLVNDAYYSVAEHCSDVAYIIKLMGGSVLDQFCGLMHDSPETYLSDISAPFKPQLGNYYELEALVWKRVAAKFELPEVLPDIVKKADWMALFLEARKFVVPNNVSILQNWVGWLPHGANAFKLSEEHEWEPWGWNHGMARRMFINKFDLLWGQLHEPVA